MRRPRILVLLATPPLVFALTRLGAALFESSVRRALGGTVVEPILGEATVNRIAVVLAVAASMAIGTALWRPRQTTEAWGKGAEGERRTGQLLERLPADTFLIRHDLPIPGSRANIDHVVVGPTGVFTVETKHYKCEVVIRNGQAWSGGRSLQRVVEQAQRQAAVVQAAVGREVSPVVCVHGGGVRAGGWRTRPVVEGVRFCSGRRLTGVLTSGPARLGPEDVGSVAVLLQSRLAKPTGSGTQPGRRTAS